MGGSWTRSGDSKLEGIALAFWFRGQNTGHGQSVRLCQVFFLECSAIRGGNFDSG